MKPPRLGRGVRAVPRLNIVYPGICLTTEENHGEYREHLGRQLYRERCGPDWLSENVMPANRVSGTRMRGWVRVL